MTRTSIMLTQEIKEKAIGEARAQGISFGEFVRRALEQAIVHHKRKKSFDRSQDPLFQEMYTLSSKIQSSISDASIHHDDYLYGKKTKMK